MLNRRSAALVVPLLLAGPLLPRRASAAGEPGDVIENVELKALDGRKIAIAGKKAAVNVVVFFRPEQEFSADALEALATCEKEYAAKPVNWVAVASDSWTPEQLRAVAAKAGVQMPILVDAGDALYGRLEVRLHPYVVMLDKDRRVVVREPFHKIGYCDRIRALLRYALKEIGADELARLENPEKATFRVPGGVAKRHLNYGRLLLEQKKWDKALEQADKALAEGPLAAAYVLRGNALAGMGKCAEALAAFDAALKLEPNDEAAQVGRRACGK